MLLHWEFDFFLCGKAINEGTIFLLQAASWSLIMVDFCVNVHGLKSLWRLEVSTTFFSVMYFNMNVSLAKVHCELNLVTEFIFDKMVLGLSQQQKALTFLKVF